MAHQLVHTIRQIARHETQQRWAPALGVVTSVFGSNGAADYACTVELRELGIVLPRVPIATNLIGAAALPRAQDLVVVVFAGGDLHAPIVVGRLYNEAVAPPENHPGELVLVLPGDETATDKRLEVRINTPGDGSRAATLTLDGQVKTTLTIDDEGVRVEVGDTKLSLKQTNGSNGAVEISAGEAKMTLKQGGDITLETSGKLTIKGASVEISGDTTVKIGGQTVNIN
jgi:uncharacterized protein involved in type VI secretion and phage assembly